MIKCIIFDFDGVIAESVQVKTEAFKELFIDRNSKILQQILEYHSKNSGVSRFVKFKHIYKEILNEPLSEDDFNTYCERFSKLVLDKVVESDYVPGAKEFLENESQNYLCFVATGTPKEEIDIILDRKQISTYFKQVYGSPVKKGEAAKKILDDEKLLPHEILFIGDALADYNAAKENNLHFIARINEDNISLFNNIDCRKTDNLKSLKENIEIFNAL